MSRDEALALLREHKPVLERRFGVVDLALFGSFARDGPTAGGDIDVLVRFDGPADWRRYFGRVRGARSSGCETAWLTPVCTSTMTLSGP